MPSPFPGMDPYLELPRLWRSAHNTLITCLMAQLNAVLPDGFSATSEERVYVQLPDAFYYPDIVTRQEMPFPVPQIGRGNVAVLERATVAEPISMPRRVQVVTEEERELFVEIQNDDSGEIVAVIEVLSPANKSSAGNGRGEYTRNQRHFLASAVHLLEIDLLRAGLYTVAVPEAVVRTREKTLPPYIICLHRGGQFGTTHTMDYWPVSLREPLPVIGLPLSEGYADVAIDIQAVFTQMYDAGPFARRTDYRGELEPPLSPDDAAWADELLRAEGLR